MNKITAIFTIAGLAMIWTARRRGSDVIEDPSLNEECRLKNEECLTPLGLPLSIVKSEKLL